MDQFKKMQFKDIGPGGIHCPCCNRSRGKLKNSHVGKTNKLNKAARARLKQQLQNNIQSGTSD